MGRALIRAIFRMTLAPWEVGARVDSPFLEAALEAAGKGWHVFPLTPNGKVPLLRGNWQEHATTDPVKIREWWTATPAANIGIATGARSGVSVVDVDVKGGRPGEESAQRLGLPLLDTHTIRTATGGYHYYFEHVDGFRNRAGVLPGLDTRGDGGYVVGEGSVIGGEGYELANVGDIQPMPESVLRIAGTRPDPGDESNPDSQAFDITGDELAEVWAAVGRIDSTPYEDWLTVGMALYEMGCGSEQLFRVWDNWSARADNYDRRIMRARWRSFASDRPDKITESTFWRMAAERGHTRPPVDLVFVPEQNDTLEFNLDDLDQWTPPPLDEIEIWRESVIARGNMTLIAGPPKVGKSMLVQHLLMAAASGRDFLGHGFRRPHRVLWLQAEMRKVYLKVGRIGPATARAGYSPGELADLRRNFYATDRLDLELTTKREFDLLAKMVARVRPDILVIDPIINFSSAQENDSGETKALLRAARQLASAGGVDPVEEPALVIIHHTRKTDARTGVGGDPFELIRGSGAFRGYYDSGIMLLPDKAGSIAMHFETRNQRSPETQGIRYSSDRACWMQSDLEIEKNEDGNYSALKGDDPVDTIIRILSNLNDPAYLNFAALVRAVMQACDVGETTAEKLIVKARKTASGVIGWRGRGREKLYYHRSNEWKMQAEFDNNGGEKWA